MLTRRGWSLLGASFGLLVAGRLLGTVELAALSIAGFGLIVFGLWWTRRQPTRVRVERLVRPARLHVGDEGRVDLTMTNVGSRQSPVLAVTDTFRDGRRAARFLVAPLPAGSSGRGAYRVPTTRRGRFPLGPLTVALTDPFGLVRRAWHAGEVDDVVVAPRVRGASPLRGLLYAFWGRRSRLASARGGFPLGCMSVVHWEWTGDHATAAPARRDRSPSYRETLRKRAVFLERVMGAETRVLFRCCRGVSPGTGTLPKYEMSNLFPTNL